MAIHFEEKEGMLLVLQIDHLSGEEAGWILEMGAIPGLRNRQLIPTVTKKGRPGYLLLLDIDPGQEERAVQALSGHMPVFGYHRLLTRHFFQGGALSQITVALRVADGRSLEASIHYRSVAVGGKSRIFFETDDLSELQCRAREELGVEIAPWELKQRLEEASGKMARPIEIEL